MASDNNSGANIPGYESSSEGGMEAATAPMVAAAPGKFFLILFLGVLFLFAVLFFVFSSGGEKEEKMIKEGKPEKPAKEEFQEAPPPPPPAVLPPPRTIAPEVPEAPPLPPVTMPDEQAPTDEKYLERLRSDMMIFSSTQSLNATEEDQRRAEEDLAANDPNLAFASKAFRASEAAKVKAGHIGNLYATIGQGKLIHGVLETAINTQLPGVIRAIISRDIYAEAGNARLIPKGSRLIGVYNTDVFRGQSRIFIVWTRVLRPDGVDIMVNSPGVDKLGRAGLEGAVDGRFRELFGTAILTSIITIGAAAGADAVLGDEQTTTTRGADGSTSTTGSNTSQAAGESIKNIGGVAKRVIDNIIDTRPVIDVDQGTKINVMVNRDLIFPSSVVEQTNFVE